MQLEFVVDQPLAHVGLERRASIHCGLHRGVEKPQRVAAGGLGLVHRHVCAFECFIHRAASVYAEQRDTDTGAAAVLAPRNVVRLAQLQHDFFGHRFRMADRVGRGGADVVDHHHELVAPQTRHGVALAHARQQAARHLL